MKSAYVTNLRRCYGASEIDAEQNVPLPEDVKKLVAVEGELDMLATLTKDYPEAQWDGYYRSIRLGIR